MSWLLLALFTAMSVAFRDALIKRGVEKVDEYIVTFTLSAVTSVLLGATVAVLGPPDLGSRFWVALLGSGVPNVIAMVLLAKAVKYSDLSLVAPLMGLTPLFMLVTSPIIVGEFPGPVGLLGIATIVAGAYLLNIGEGGVGVWAPFRALLHDRGARHMLGVAALWSISAVVDKVGVRNSSAIAWPFAINLFIAGTLLPVILYRGRSASWAPVAWLRANGRPLFLAGAVNALSISAQMTALTMTLAAYVIAVKRSSILFAVLLGAGMFRERGIARRMLGAVVIVAGIVVFTLS